MSNPTSKSIFRFQITKRFVFIVLIICTSNFLYSQDNELSFGLTGGLTNSNMRQVKSLPGTYSFKPGLSTIMFLNLKTVSNFTFETDIGYYQNGYKHSDKSLIIAPDYTAKNSFVGFEFLETQNYINNSWIAGYDFGERFTFNINLGFYWAVYMNTTIKSTVYYEIDPTESSSIDLGLESGYHEETDKETNRNEGISNFDFGLSGGIICGYNINEKYHLRLITRYNHGLVDINKSEAISDLENYNISFFTGIGIEIKI